MELSYDQCARFFAKARDKSKGKPVNSWTRMFYDKVTGSYNFHIYNNLLAFHVTPENKLVFDLSVSKVNAFAQTLVGYMHRITPFRLERIGHGRYSVLVFGDYRAPQNTNPPEYFEGIMFDLDTLNCVNRMQDQTKEVDPERRREWLRAMKRYRMGLQLRAKIGALDAYIVRVKAEAKTATSYDWKHPDWNETQWIAQLADSMKRDDYSYESLSPLIQSVPTSLFRGAFFYNIDNITPQTIVDMFNYLVKSYSIQLRRAFGVFDVKPK